MEVFLKILIALKVIHTVLSSSQCVQKGPICSPGCFFDSLTHICKLCKSAMPGEIYTRNCSATANSRTAPCFKNQYTYDNFKCHNCTDCEDKNIKKHCTLSGDAVCMKYTPEQSRSYAVEIGVGFAFGFVIVVAVTYVIVWYCKSRNNNVNNNSVVWQRDIEGNHGHENSFTDVFHGEEERDEVAPLELAASQKRGGYQRTNSQISQSSITTNGSVEPLTDKSNAASLSLQSSSRNTSTLSLNSASSLRWTTTSIEDLSFGCRDELAKLLAPDSLSNWEHLADKLGFNIIEINNFAMAKGSKSVLQMLYAYNGRKDATIPALYDALVAISRHDACKVIRKYQKELK